MRKYFLNILAILQFGILSAQNVNSILHISSTNNDWKENLKSALLKHSNDTLSKGILTIQFEPGRYNLMEGLLLTRTLTASSHSQIILKGGTDVIFTGGLTLKTENLKKVVDPNILKLVFDDEAKKHLLEYNLSAITNLDYGEQKPIGFKRSVSSTPAQLVLNGKRMTLARYPNETSIYLQKNRQSVLPIHTIVSTGQPKVELPLSNNRPSNERGSFKYEDARINRWANKNNIWVDGIFSRDWSWSLNRIESIDSVAKSIVLAFPEAYDLTATNSFFFASNVFEEIDVPGEYFIDVINKKLYLYPPDGIDLAKSSFELTQNKTSLLELTGFSHIRIEDIQFEMGRNTGVKINQCNDISFFNCNFRLFGTNALWLKGDNLIVNQSVIEQIGGTAISLDGGNLNTLTPSGNKIMNCSIHDWAQVNRVYTPAIALSGVGNEIIHNHIFKAPHGAITLSGNNHVIASNNIHDVLLEFKDFGAIYGFLGTNPLMRGHLIKDNYFHNIGNLGEGVHAIYADEGTAGWVISNNVFFKIGHSKARVAAILGNSSTYLNIHDNIFIDCAETFEESFHFSTWGKKRFSDYFQPLWQKLLTPNIPPKHLVAYPELANFFTEDKIYVTTNNFSNNIIGNFSIVRNHENFYRTQSNLPNADSLIMATDNHITLDKTISDFLENDYGKTSKPIPESLKKYRYFSY